MKHKNVLTLLGFAIIATALLSFANISRICGTTSGCITVKNSIYSNIFGVSTAIIGLFFISTLFLIILFNKNKIINDLVKVVFIIGSIVAIFFIYLQLFVINAICKYCMVTDISLILASIIFFYQGINK